MTAGEIFALDTNALLRFMLRDDEAQFDLIAPHIIKAEANSCLICAQAKTLGVSEILTFDKKAKSTGMTYLLAIQ